MFAPYDLDFHAIVNLVVKGTVGLMISSCKIRPQRKWSVILDLHSLIHFLSFADKLQVYDIFVKGKLHIELKNLLLQK